MTEPTSGLPLLATKLCPWLEPALQQLEDAHRQRRLGHAWLIAGPAGVGKTNLVLAFADRLLTGRTASTPPELSPAEALEAMRNRHVPADHHPDLHWVFPAEDKKSIAVEQIRDIAEVLSLKSHRGGAKVVVIDTADDMTNAAANALLKTLEEPSDDTYLLLLSHQPGRLTATIRSRCQRLDIRPPPAAVSGAWLGIVDEAKATALGWLTGGAPLRMAELFQSNELSKNKELVDLFALISEDKTDLQTAAEGWKKGGEEELVLTWLTRQLHRTLRVRLAPNVSTAVTDRETATLHNAWSDLTLRGLFEQYDRTQRLLTQLGSGINLELALQSLLLGFQGKRGRL